MLRRGIKKEGKEKKKKKIVGKMKVLELALFIQFYMRMLLVRFFNLDTLTCTDNQAH